MSAFFKLHDPAAPGNDRQLTHSQNFDDYKRRHAAALADVKAHAASVGHCVELHVKHYDFGESYAERERVCPPASAEVRAAAKQRRNDRAEAALHREAARLGFRCAR